MTLKVNGEPIPQEAIDYEYRRLVQFYSEFMPLTQIEAQSDILKKRAREQAIGAKLLLMEAEKLDIPVSEEQIDEQEELLAEELGGKEAFLQRCQEQGISRESVRKNIKIGCKVNNLIKKITENVPDPTEEEMKEHYEQHKNEYKIEPRVQVQHILIALHSDDPDEYESALERLLEIKNQIESGADFAEMAFAYSDCPSGKRTGGSLGWISKGTVIPEVEEVIFSLKVGEISGVVKTPLGLHIFKKTAEEEGSEPTFVEIADKIREFLRHVKRGNALAAYVNELKAKAIIEED